MVGGRREEAGRGCLTVEELERNEDELLGYASVLQEVPGRRRARWRIVLPRVEGDEDGGGSGGGNGNDGGNGEGDEVGEGEVRVEGRSKKVAEELERNGWMILRPVIDA